jgi:hypothetical protein
VCLLDTRPGQWVFGVTVGEFPQQIGSTFTVTYEIKSHLEIHALILAINT